MGMQSTQSQWQIINLDENSWISKRKVQHEIMHASDLFHVSEPSHTIPESPHAAIKYVHSIWLSKFYSSSSQLKFQNKTTQGNVLNITT